MYAEAGLPDMQAYQTGKGRDPSSMNHPIFKPAVTS